MFQAGVPVAGPRSCRDTMYKCSYTRLMYPKMSVVRGQNAQGTVTGEAGRPADFRRRARRPVPGPPAPGPRVLPPVGSAPPPAGLSPSGLRHLTAVLAHEMARNTQTNYRGQWQHFRDWALGKGIRALPADAGPGGRIPGRAAGGIRP